MNDTPETQAAFLLFDTGEQGLHYVSEQMRRIERERDQNNLDMLRYLEAYQKEQVKNYELLCELQHMKASRNKWRICCEATIITLALLTLLYFFE